MADFFVLSHFPNDLLIYKTMCHFLQTDSQLIQTICHLLHIMSFSKHSHFFQLILSLLPNDSSLFQNVLICSKRSVIFSKWRHFFKWSPIFQSICHCHLFQKLHHLFQTIYNFSKRSFSFFKGFITSSKRYVTFLWLSVTFYWRSVTFYDVLSPLTF